MLLFLVCIVFEESDISYWFMANSAKDQDEWSTALSSGRYVCQFVCYKKIMKAYPENVYHTYWIYVYVDLPPTLCVCVCVCVCVCTAMSTCVWHSVSCGDN